MPTPNVQALDQREIKVPFQIGEDGGIAYVTTESERASQHIRTVLLTLLGERVMRPNYGSRTKAYLFSISDEREHELLAEEIKEAIRIHLPEVTIDNVVVNTSEYEETVVGVNITYRVGITTGAFRLDTRSVEVAS